jgi:hypothetical protein
MPMVAQPEPRKNGPHTCTFGSSRKKKQDGECWQFTLWLCDMPMDFARYATVGKVEAESQENPLDLDYRFYLDGCTTVRTEALRRGIF